MAKKKVIALDFDGVLHQYDGWRDGTIYGDPVVGAVETLNRWKDKYNLVIFTCRVPIKDVREWVFEKFGFNIVVTNMKPHADLYIDDRGCRFEGDWNKTASYVEGLDRKSFSTWTGDKKLASPARNESWESDFFSGYHEVVDNGS